MSLEPPELDDEYKTVEAEIRGIAGSVMARACSDVFTFAMRVRTGELIYFSSAEYLGNGWFKLDFSDLGGHSDGLDDINLSRGMDIHIQHIVWVVDAPFGS